MRVDRYILGITSGPVAVGVYSLAGTLSEFPRLLPIATGQIMLREASLGRGSSTSTRLMRIAVLITAVGCVLVGVLGWFLIPPVFGPGFADARGLLVVLLAAEICFAPYAVASRGLLGGGWTVTAGSLGMVGAAGGVGLYAISAHIGGPTGTAVASVGLYAALSAASWLLLRRKFQVHSVATADPLASEPLARG
jgi:O-antigen/teichoic acid export membrane protein